MVLTASLERSVHRIVFVIAFQFFRLCVTLRGHSCNLETGEAMDAQGKTEIEGKGYWVSDAHRLTVLSQKLPKIA